MTITKLLIEIALALAVIWLVAHEEQIAKLERAFIGALIWTYEEHKEKRRANGN